MFVRLKKTPNSTKTAVQLVENIRAGKSVKQKVIRHFGYALDAQEIESLKKIAYRYQLELEEQHQPNLFAKEDLLSQIKESAQQVEQDDSPLPVNLRDIKEEKRICVGIHHGYGSLFDAIGFDKVIKDRQRRKASVEILRNMVMARIVKPASKRSSTQMLAQEYGINLDVNAVYRMMDFVDEEAIDRAKQMSYEYSKSLLGEKINVVFYDCTTLYFESFIEDELKQNGYSKDGKHHQSQVLLALMVTQAGLPIGYELYNGNKFEGHTLDDALRRLHQVYQIDKLIFVADAGLLSKDNLDRFRELEQPFIVGARIKNVSHALTQRILNRSAYTNLYPNNQAQAGEAITYQDIKMEDENLRLILTYSPKRAAKDKHDREKAIEALKKRIGKNKNPSSLLSNFGYKKFLKIEGQATLVTDESKIKEAEQWDGLHGILTNVSEQEETAQSLLHHYKGLWQVEETFRLSKHDLSMRPIFHWTPGRIHAHIAICFMALMCIRTMEYRVALQYKKMSPAAIRNELVQLEISIVKDYKTLKEYAIPSKSSQDAKKIYQILGLKWNDTPFQIKKKITV